MQDPQHLLTQQYRDASNLDARIALHARYSTNPYSIQAWLFDHLLTLPAEVRILELGCGPGTLWLNNLHRIPAGWDVTLSDFSPGMLDDARSNLQAAVHPFTFKVIDAQQIPFPDGNFDAVIANFMLYHVPDRPKAFSEIARVLRPGGRLHAATLGLGHMKELKRLRILAANQDPDLPSLGGSLIDAFGLENGAEQIAPWLPNVTLHRYEDSLKVTEVEPLEAYVLSSTFGQALAAEELGRFRVLASSEIEQHGAFHITKESGLFIASATHT